MSSQLDASAPMTRRERRALEEAAKREDVRPAFRKATAPAGREDGGNEGEPPSLAPVPAIELRPRGSARKALKPRQPGRFAAVGAVAGVGAAGVALAAVLMTGGTQPEPVPAEAKAAPELNPLQPAAVGGQGSEGDAVSGGDPEAGGERMSSFAGGVPDVSERDQGDAASRSITRTVLPGCDGERPQGEVQNGQLPEEWLCEIGIDGHKLRADAAVAFAKMNAAYKADTGKDLIVTDSYRSLEGQISVAARKPGFAARPGTSQHGWGLAIDFGGGMSSGTGQQYEWLVANGERFGWENPDWAARNNYELWHWEYFPGRD
ncbi:M15 family metallopeptidase [Sediminivirga luteola]|uniref:D-alanyl-D-alanine carboxypeptidase-like core domain-containing protein n=1 Tax=Sediminivirga luteola TaxID=1774748 RepID=A0A8J2TWB1_9MICO|nr:M15 family metallopeptidase [Sediminivirga luteola]MCI2266525.1 M15 family metallopeptidase [Sediminivirga luteola]GGA07669.1 hypothetical protein GCM10011333_08020 [Sediminivirga luteola]